MLGDLLTAGGLVLIIEGLMPALSPQRWRQMIEQVERLSDRTLRAAGIVLILVGAASFHLAA